MDTCCLCLSAAMSVSLCFCFGVCGSKGKETDKDNRARRSLGLSKSIASSLRLLSPSLQESPCCCLCSGYFVCDSVYLCIFVCLPLSAPANLSLLYVSVTLCVSLPASVSLSASLSVVSVSALRSHSPQESLCVCVCNTRCMRQHTCLRSLLSLQQTRLQECDGLFVVLAVCLSPHPRVPCCIILRPCHRCLFPCLSETAETATKTYKTENSLSQTETEVQDRI